MLYFVEIFIISITDKKDKGSTPMKAGVFEGVIEGHNYKFSSKGNGVRV